MILISQIEKPLNRNGIIGFLIGYTVQDCNVISESKLALQSRFRMGERHDKRLVPLIT